MKNLMGLGYRAPFHGNLIDGHSEIGWLEIITENYLWDAGKRRKNLEKLRSHYDLAFHGVTLSLAAPQELDKKYLNQLKNFCDELKPVRVSDHLCWSSTGEHFWHDLLPFPYTEENLNRLIEKVLAWQDVLQRPLVLENLSAYIRSNNSEMSEYEFLARLVKKTNCQILLDLNNMIVNAKNFNIDPYEELKHIDLKSVSQVHLAGHVDGKNFAIDTHSKEPNAETWKLWAYVSERAKIPYMIEWDDDIPTFETVYEQLQKAKSFQGAKL